MNAKRSKINNKEERVARFEQSKSDEVKMDRRNNLNICDMCQRSGDIARFCPNRACEGCHELGHIERDCPRQFELRQFRLWLPFNSAVRVGVNRNPLREMSGIGPNLQLLRNMKATTVNGSTFSSEFNSLCVEYGGHGTAVIAMQSDAETLIHIHRVYQDGVYQAHVKVSAKYTVTGGKLIEALDRLATGSRQQQTPQVDTHVLLHVPGMLDSTVAMEINGVRFFLEWGRQRLNGCLRADVYVSSQHTYNFRRSNMRRELVLDGWAYFRGEIREAPRPADIRPNQAVDTPIIAAADEPDGNNAIENIDPVDEEQHEMPDPASANNNENEERELDADVAALLDGKFPIEFQANNAIATMQTDDSGDETKSIEIDSSDELYETGE